MWDRPSTLVPWKEALVVPSLVHRSQVTSYLACQTKFANDMVTTVAIDPVLAQIRQSFFCWDLKRWCPKTLTACFHPTLLTGASQLQQVTATQLCLFWQQLLPPLSALDYLRLAKLIRRARQVPVVLLKFLWPRLQVDLVFRLFPLN